MLTSEQISFFHEHGYLHLPGALPRENCQAVVDATFEFLGMRADRPDEWYRPPLRHDNGGMVELYQHESLWRNRQEPLVYEAFCSLYEETKLLVTMDRVSMKLPPNPKFPAWRDKGFLHLDCDPRDATWALKLALQGVVYLRDTDESMGGFWCVPGFHRKIKEWAKAVKDQRPADPPSYQSERSTPIVGKAGDMVIWDVMLPHGNGLNESNRPRMAQYITTVRAAMMGDAEKADRLRRFREGIPTFDGSSAKSNPRGQESWLTSLGRKLLGLDPW